MGVACWFEVTPCLLEGVKVDCDLGLNLKVLVPAKLGLKHLDRGEVLTRSSSISPSLKKRRVWISHQILNQSPVSRCLVELR